MSFLKCRFGHVTLGCSFSSQGRFFNRVSGMVLAYYCCPRVSPFSPKSILVRMMNDLTAWLLRPLPMSSSSIFSARLLGCENISHHLWVPGFQLWLLILMKGTLLTAHYCICSGQLFCKLENVSVSACNRTFWKTSKIKSWTAWFMFSALSAEISEWLH